MAGAARQLVGWSDQRWAAVQEAAGRALARAAKCRHVIPKGSDLIRAKTVPVPTVSGGPHGTPGPATYKLEDKFTAPAHLYAEFQIDDREAADEPAILRLVGSAAAEVGRLEDALILRGEIKMAKVPASPPSSLADQGEEIAFDGSVINATNILSTISNAVSKIEENRPGPCALILANELLARLRTPVHAGDVLPLNQAELLIGTSEIVGSGELNKNKGATYCGILFRLEPAAADIVHTQALTIAVQGRAGGDTTLRVEEEIALRVLDPNAIVRIQRLP